MTETLPTEYNPSVEGTQARVLEWAAQYTGADAEAASILAQNTISLLGWASLSEQVRADPNIPHPSEPARNFKATASQPVWHETQDPQPAAYITHSGHVYEGSQASSLRAADRVLERAEDRRNQYDNQDTPLAPHGSRRTSSGQGGSAAKIIPQATNLYQGQQPLFEGTLLGEASGRMAIVAEAERRDDWQDLPFEKKYPGSQDPELAKAYLAATEEFDRTREDPQSPEARAASDKLFALDMKMREPYDSLAATSEEIVARPEVRQQAEVTEGAIGTPLIEQTAAMGLNVEASTPPSRAEVAAANSQPLVASASVPNTAPTTPGNER